MRFLLTETWVLWIFRARQELWKFSLQIVNGTIEFKILENVFKKPKSLKTNSCRIRKFLKFTLKPNMFLFDYSCGRLVYDLNISTTRWYFFRNRNFLKSRKVMSTSLLTRFRGCRRFYRHFSIPNQRLQIWCLEVSTGF